jgi:hypothetical protein
MVRSFASFDWLAKIATPPQGILNANVLLIFHLGCCFFSYIFEYLRDWMLWAFLHFTMRQYLLFFSPLFFVGDAAAVAGEQFALVAGFLKFVVVAHGAGLG